MPVYKTVKARPIKVVNKKNENVDVETILEKLRLDAERLTTIVEWHLKSDKNLREDIKDNTLTLGTTIPAKIGERLKITLPNYFMPNGRSGHSRYERMLQGRVVKEADSWGKRSDVVNETNKGYVSAGWKRTASDAEPTDLKPKMSLADAGDDRYVKFIDDPLTCNGFFRLKLVVDGEWHILTFSFDKERFKGAKKACLPDIIIDSNDKVRFAFPMEYEYYYAGISSEYVLGVDVGVKEPATVSIIHTKTMNIVHATTLSRRVQSLKNSINATNKQKNRLWELGRDRESAFHRGAVKRKRRELAILIGQEIAELAHTWDNALVIVEDLSWVADTNQNGRWNRGEVVKWVNHFVLLNGGLVYKVNAAYSSQKCHSCHLLGVLDSNNRTFTCSNGQCENYLVPFDRDVNAAAELASRVVTSTALSTTISNRKKKKHYKSRVSRRSVSTHQVLKYPGRDRTKTGITTKRPKKTKTGSRLITPNREVTNTTSAPGTLNECTVSEDVQGKTMPETVKSRKNHYSNQRRAHYSHWLK